MKRPAAKQRATPDSELSHAAAEPQIALEPDRERAERVLLEMMAIRGGSCHEAQVAEFIHGQFRRAGVPGRAIQSDTAHRHGPHGGEQGNLIVRLPGTIPGRRLSLIHI